MKKIVLAICLFFFSITTVYADNVVKTISGNGNCKIKAIQNDNGYYLNIGDYFLCYKEYSYSIAKNKVEFTRPSTKFIDSAKVVYTDAKLTTVINLDTKKYVTYIRSEKKTWMSSVKFLTASNYIKEDGELYFSLRLFSDSLKGSFSLSSDKITTSFTKELNQKIDTKLTTKIGFSDVKSPVVNPMSKEFVEKYLGKYDYATCKVVLENKYCTMAQDGQQICDKTCTLAENINMGFPKDDPRTLTQFQWLDSKEAAACKAVPASGTCNSANVGQEACGYTCMSTNRSFKTYLGTIYSLNTKSGIVTFQKEVGRPHLAWDDAIAKSEYLNSVANIGKGYNHEAAILYKQYCSSSNCTSCTEKPLVMGVTTSLQGLTTSSTLYPRNSTNNYSICESDYLWIQNVQVQNALEHGYGK